MISRSVEPGVPVRRTSFRRCQLKLAPFFAAVRTFTQQHHHARMDPITELPKGMPALRCENEIVQRNDADHQFWPEIAHKRRMPFRDKHERVEMRASSALRPIRASVAPPPEIVAP